MKKYSALLPIYFFFLLTQSVSAASITSVNPQNLTVPVYDKYEVRFNVSTSATFYLFQYDPNPPPGVTPSTGITVEATITAPSGKILKEPGFYMTEATPSSPTDPNATWTETANSYWAVRFSPQEQGTYSVSLKATDSSGSSTVSAGSFTATSPISDGFVKVSKTDTRYFEFSNGNLFWPVGPAWMGRNGWEYVRYKDKGNFVDRPWLGGLGMYSANWARWKSSAESLGNEGISSRLAFINDPNLRPPNSDGLVQDITYPAGHSMWLTNWLDERFFTPLNGKYKAKIIYKLQNVQGPRNSAFDYGFSIRTGNYWWPSSSESLDQFDAHLRSMASPLQNLKSAPGWTTAEAIFTTSNASSIWLYLDNVSAGNAQVSYFSIKPCVDTNCASLGGEVVRNPSADIHTYVEQRPAAYLDKMVEDARKAGVFLTLVVHDKNDPIINLLKTNGTWNSPGDGYYQPENTKARWLLRQWYRYIAARWGYSTSIYAYEMNNEGPPNADGTNSAGRPTASHWESAQAFAKFMHDLNQNGSTTDEAHPHLAVTSNWCCWRPEFWGNNIDFPDISYGDIHQYDNNFDSSKGSITLPYDDTASFLITMGRKMFADNIGKPIQLGEVGLGTIGQYWTPMTLSSQQSEVVYHNLLWADLDYASVYPIGYWYSQHLDGIDWPGIARPHYLFTKSLDLNSGGFIDSQATSSNSNLIPIGQKNLSKNKGHLWIQNTNHKYTNLTASAQNATISIQMNPSTSYYVEYWDTYTGNVTNTTSITSDGSGKLSFPVSNVSTDLAVKFYSTISPPTPTRPAPGGGNPAVIIDILSAYLTTQPPLDYVNDGLINMMDFASSLK